MIRDHTTPINGYLYRQLQIVAELEGMECAENVLEIWLREKLSTMPQIAELADMRAIARKAADTAWRAKYVTKTGRQLEEVA